MITYTYSWNIVQLDCAPSENGLTNVVKVIHWEYVGQDENNFLSFVSNKYPLPDPSPESFNDYSSLTKEIVISWLESGLDMDYLRKRIVKEIASQYNPPIGPFPLPWIAVNQVEENVQPIEEENVQPIEEENVQPIEEENVQPIEEAPLPAEIIPPSVE